MYGVGGAHVLGEGQTHCSEVWVVSRRRPQRKKLKARIRAYRMEQVLSEICLRQKRRMLLYYIQYIHDSLEVLHSNPLEKIVVIKSFKRI